MRPLLVDASFLVALYDRREAHHSRCVQVYTKLDQPLVTCEPIVAETLHLLRFDRRAISDVLSNIQKGALSIPFKLSEAAASVQSIMSKYSDLPADFADACLIHMADELDTGDILTLDRDFRHYSWRRNRRFRLLIPLDDF
jgi:predicted nucleic acid-binding protein